jgi:hypothetical protein
MAAFWPAASTNRASVKGLDEEIMPANKKIDKKYPQEMTFDCKLADICVS